MEIFILILIIIILAAILSLQKKGILSKRRAVEKELNSLPSDKYKLLSNILIKTKYTTFNIEYVLVSIYGIFVINIKDCKGEIVGSENDEYWINNINNRTKFLKNPVIESNEYIEALMHKLEVSDSELFIPIIAFSNNCDLRASSTYRIVRVNQIKRAIQKNMKIRLSCYDMILFVNKLRSKNNTIEKVEKDIKLEIIKENKKDIDICPKCGADLISRKGESSAYKECSNYPECKYITR